MRILGNQVSEEIRIDLVGQSPFTEIGAGMDAFNPHLPHGRLNELAAHRKAFFFENGRDPAASVKRPARVNFVDPVLETDLLFRRFHRPIVESGAGNAGQVGLLDQGQVGVVIVHKASALFMTQLIPDFFLIQFNWVVNCPIS